MEAVFTATPKYPGALLSRLNSIKVYDKREGTSKLTKTIALTYQIAGASQRAFLSVVNVSGGCLSANYAMEYYSGELPPYDETYHVDEWSFYKSKGITMPDIPYSESSIVGSLKRITYPYKGYDVFFYEPHTYSADGSVSQGAGIRLKKMITYDGVSSGSDNVKEYEYTKADGSSSGKLQYKAQHEFPVARHEKVIHGNSTYFPMVTYNRRYQEYLSTYPVNLVDNLFRLNSTTELSNFTPLHGSAVAYERVVVRERDAGHSIYEYDLPASYGDASANSNEWNASKVSVARPSTGTSNCFELATIQEGINKYPFPPDPNYEFARALLKKVTNFREDGIAVHDVVFNYQRVYGNGSSIRKLYGLALEELPTYYYNGSSYQDAKMFLYSKYEIFTEVKTELSSQTETVYNSTDLTKKTVTTTSYFFESANHKELTRIETLNSDGSIARNRLKYAKDYIISSPSGVAATAIVNLNAANRTAIVESTTTKIFSGVEKYLGASLTLFQTVGGKVFPDKNYSFVSNSGITTFTPTSISGGTTFQFDQTNYILDKTYLNFDSYGNATEMIDRSRNVSSVSFGYGGTIPIIKVSNARISELRYSDFETTTPADFFITWPSPSTGVGRNNSKGLNLPAGTEFSNNFSNAISYDPNKPGNYLLSIWIKAATAGNLSIWVGAASNSTFTFPYTASTDYKYYRFSIPVVSVVGAATSFNVKLWSSAAIQVDDMAFYPVHADFIASTYIIPNGKNSETDSRGISNYFDYDLWNRLKVVYDQDKNVVKKYDYQVRP
jgi:hypothetical protein